MTLDCEDPSFGGGVDTATFDFGGLVGLGVSLDMGARAALTLDGMFNLGRSAIDETLFGPVDRNRAFMVTAGVSFAIGG